MTKQSYPKPRQCKQVTRWHGFQLEPGQIFGEDEKGLYITTPYESKGKMRFIRYNPNTHKTITVWESKHAAPIINEIKRYFGVLPYPKREESIHFYSGNVECWTKPKTKSTMRLNQAYLRQSDRDFQLHSYDLYGTLNKRITDYLEGV